MMRQVVVPEARSALSSPPLPRARFFPQRPPSGKVPVQARSRSDKCAAVLRLQRTQPKDRRIYTAFTGILAGQRPHREDRGVSPGTGQGRHAGGRQGRGSANIFYLHPCDLSPWIYLAGCAKIHNVSAPAGPAGHEEDCTGTAARCCDIHAALCQAGKRFVSL